MGRDNSEALVKCVEVVYTGSMAQYIPALEFYTGRLPLVSMRCVSSEGYFGINLNPLSKPSEVSYTLPQILNSYQLMKFRKKRQKDPHNGLPDSNCMVVDLVNVKIGQCYELLKFSSLLSLESFSFPKFNSKFHNLLICKVSTDAESETC